MKKIKKIDLFRVLIRSFFIQAVWNFKSMLSIGLSFALVPVVKRLTDNRIEMGRILKRYLFFFNAHPFMASYALGAFARLEEECANGEIKNEEQIDRFKNAIIGPLGAIGDTYFWATIKPAAVLTGCVGVLVFQETYLRVLSILLMLLLYNLPHMHVRISGLTRGYAAGYQTYRYLTVDQFKHTKALYKVIGSIMLGTIIGFLLIKSGFEERGAVSLFLLSGLLGYYLRLKQKSIQLSILSVICLAIIIGVL